MGIEKSATVDIAVGSNTSVAAVGNGLSDAVRADKEGGVGVGRPAE